jgi:ABC-type polysaccharide/polyol phosphate transport system ATPase subunit
MSGVVRLRGVSKQFLVSHEKPALVRELVPRLVRPPRYERHWALQEIDLDLRAGSALGLIGPNGSGKTTLLSVITGITKPTSGTVSVRGRVVALLGLGSGFHPELSGLENIFLNGTLLGMRTRELRRKLEAIVAFSGLDGFINAPLQTYSTGMQLRLGFAIAIHADFDLLLLDEVWAVGDLAFQQQCLATLRALRSRGKTLVLVAQAAESLEPLCDRVVLLERGRIIVDGPVQMVGMLYRQRSAPAAPRETPETVHGRRLRNESLAAASAKADAEHRQGTGEIQIHGVEFLDRAGRAPAAFQTGERWIARIPFTVRSPVLRPRFGLAMFREPEFTYVYGPNTAFDGLELPELPEGEGELRLVIDRLSLLGGTYRVSVAWWRHDPHALQHRDYQIALPPYDYHPACYRFQVHSPEGVTGLCVLPHEFISHDHDGVEADQPRTVMTGAPLRLHPVPRTPRTSGRGGSGIPEGRFPEATGFSPWGGVHAEKTYVQIIRDDGLECFGLWCHDDLLIQECNLLPGRYWIHGDHQRLQELIVSSSRRDHGCVYLPHRWTLACPAGEGASPAAVEVRR